MFLSTESYFFLNKQTTWKTIYSLIWGKSVELKSSKNKIIISSYLSLNICSKSFSIRNLWQDFIIIINNLVFTKVKLFFFFTSTSLWNVHMTEITGCTYVFIKNLISINIFQPTFIFHWCSKCLDIWDHLETDQMATYFW